MNGNSSNCGITGFCGAIAIVFIALKLTDVINWSWLWVLSPIWIPILIFIVLLFLSELF